MKKSIISSDREIIQKSFLPEVDFGKTCWTHGELSEGFDYCFSEKKIIDNDGKGSLHSFSYINNPDGSIRWIFSSDASFPGFLDLYNSSGFKARLLAQFCRLLFLIKLQILIVSGRFYLFTRKSYLQQKWKAQMDFDSFSVFISVETERIAVYKVNLCFILYSVAL